MKASGAKRGTKREAEAAAIGEGVHAATVELAIGGGDTFGVRTLDGRSTSATLGEGVSRALVEECMRTRRAILVARGRDGVVIVGAIQTEPTVRVDDARHLAMEGETIELRADRRVSIRVGESTLTIDGDGSIRLGGDRLVIDMGALVKVLSAHVALP